MNGCFDPGGSGIHQRARAFPSEPFSSRQQHTFHPPSTGLAESCCARPLSWLVADKHGRLVANKHYTLAFPYNGFWKSSGTSLYIIVSVFRGKWRQDVVCTAGWQGLDKCSQGNKARGRETSVIVPIEQDIRRVFTGMQSPEPPCFRKMVVQLFGICFDVPASSSGQAQGWKSGKENVLLAS